jgi:hypothetical protein
MSYFDRLDSLAKDLICQQLVRDRDYPTLNWLLKTYPKTFSLCRPAVERLKNRVFLQVLNGMFSHCYNDQKEMRMVIEWDQQRQKTEVFCHPTEGMTISSGTLEDITKNYRMVKMIQLTGPDQKTLYIDFARGRMKFDKGFVDPLLEFLGDHHFSS